LSRLQFREGWPYAPFYPSRSQIPRFFLSGKT
jgi:hypothetical protein